MMMVMMRVMSGMTIKIIAPMSTFIATATGADDEEDKIILLSTIDTNEEKDDDGDDGESQIITLLMDGRCSMTDDILSIILLGSSTDIDIDLDIEYDSVLKTSLLEYEKLVILDDTEMWYNLEQL